MQVKRLKRHWLAAALGTALAGACAVSATAHAPPELDVVIRGGTVFDGSGSPGRVTDVGIRGGRIDRIGDLSGVSARERYDARGLYVAPGFIDVHAHTSTGAPLAAAKSALTQGVTTETLGPDGGGTFAITAQLEELEGIDKGINVAPYVGFNTVWRETMGEDDARPNEAQFQLMRGRIAEAMRQGAWSVSSGLGYTPAYFARTDEVIEVVKAARPWRAMFSDHIRDETNFVIESTNEVINIGHLGGLMPEVTHMKIAGPLNWGKSVSQLRLLAGARAAGTHAGGDVYPYTAAQTGLSFYVPGWAKDGGTAAMLARFADPQQRQRIDQEVTDFVIADVGVPENVAFPSLDNKTIADFIAEYGGVSIGEAVMRILEAHDGNISAVMHIGSEEDLARYIRDPFVAYSSDGGVTESASTHPRRYGSYPRVLGRYVREQGLVSWEEAIRKMTGLPATMIGMVDRGFLAPGMAADVTVFDPRTIIDRATFDQPKQYSEGVRWVFVNGTLALADGESTNAHSGKALRRASSMPTRPQNVDGRLSAAAAGTVAPLDGSRAVKLTAGLSQTGTAATGEVVIDGPGALDLRSARLGKLQTANGWFSVTGVGRLADGRERAFLLSVDEHDPLADAGETRVTIRIDGVGETYGVLRQAPLLALRDLPEVVHARAGTEVTIVARVRNQGTADATGTRVCVRARRPLVVAPACHALGDLAVGEAARVAVAVKVPRGATSRRGYKVRFAATAGDAEAVTASVRVVVRAPRLAVGGLDRTVRAARGANVILRPRIRNRGAASARKVRVCLTLSGPARKALRADGSGCRRLGSLRPGQARTAPLALKVTRAARRGTRYTLRVRARAAGVRTSAARVRVRVP